MNTQLEWHRRHEPRRPVQQYAYDGDEIVKAIPIDRPMAMASVEFGTELLEEAGLPVLPIKRQWRDENWWYYVQDRVKVHFQWTDDLVSQALEIQERAYEAGVTDLWPDNWGLASGERLVIIDAGELVTGDPKIDEPLFKSAQMQLLYAADEEAM